MTGGANRRSAAAHEKKKRRSLVVIDAGSVSERHGWRIDVRILIAPLGLLLEADFTSARHVLTSRAGTRKTSILRETLNFLIRGGRQCSCLCSSFWRILCGEFCNSIRLPAASIREFAGTKTAPFLGPNQEVKIGRVSGKAMEVAGPYNGLALREMLTRVEIEGHCCGLRPLSTRKRSTC